MSEGHQDGHTRQPEKEYLKATSQTKVPKRPKSALGNGGMPERASKNSAHNLVTNKELIDTRGLHPRKCKRKTWHFCNCLRSQSRLIPRAASADSALAYFYFCPQDTLNWLLYQNCCRKLDICGAFYCRSCRTFQNWGEASSSRSSGLNWFSEAEKPNLIV